MLCNEYGPAETHVVTALDLSAPTELWPALPNIGRPITNVRTYVLDERGEPCPVGAIGELFLGGAAVGRGYAGDPRPTAERYVPDPFGPEPGARLYRTGDLARYRADATIDFVGRADFQVKIRGYRVELGEIEAVLEQHPAVSQAVAAAQEERQGSRRLVAHVVPTSGAAPVVTELQAFLKDRLPVYMVPSAFAMVESLPLSPTGKVDRKRLPAVDAPDLASDYVGPRDGREEVVCALWCEVLGAERVGVNDDFFDLGGHSLLAIQLLNRLNQTFDGVRLPLRAIFDCPTVALLAVRIREGESGAPTHRLQPAPRDRALPLSQAQERFWFLAQLENERALYNVPFALRLRGALNSEALAWSLGEIVQRHETLRTTFALSDDGLSAVVSGADTVQLASVDLSSEGDPDGVAREIVQEGASRPIDLSTGPVSRVVLLRLRSEEHVLLIVVHHALMDVWSLRVLCDELTQLYQARCAGESSPLPALPIQYADYAYWQRQWYGEQAERDMAYWRQQLSGLSTLELSTDRPRPAVQTFDGAVHEFAISADVADRLKELCRAEGCTTFMAVLAVFKLVLARYSGQRDIAVGTPIANRSSAETEPLIGLFLNTLVLRTDLAGDSSYREVLKRVRGVTLDAFAHGELPFEQLVNELQPERDLSRHPLFQVLFVINQPARDFALGEIRAEPFGAGGDVARFDLSLNVVDAEDGFFGGLEYNVDLFDRATIERMAEHLELLITAAVEQPDRPFGDLPLLTESEQRLYDARQRRGDTYPSDRSFAELFEARAASSGDATAVVCGGEAWTYRELNVRANRMAHYLRSRGAGPGTLVGVCVERGHAMLAVLLGIIKAGAAYVPLDPSHPSERLSPHPRRRRRCALGRAGEHARCAAGRAAAVGAPRCRCRGDRQPQ